MRVAAKPLLTVSRASALMPVLPSRRPVSEVVGATTVSASKAWSTSMPSSKNSWRKEKGAAGKRGRLSNEKYVNNAPADKVQETRDMLAADEAEIAAIKTAIAELG